MVGLKNFIAAGLVVLASVSMLGQHVGGEVHHKVGDERGWDPSTNVTAWSSGRIFKVGDIIWFTYRSAAKESVVELQSMGEFLACDLTNPIRMYTEGLDKVSLDGEGSRYFASGNLESCKKGLRIHVNVHPTDQNHTIDDGPPSSEDKDFPPPEKPAPPYDPYPQVPPAGGSPPPKKRAPPPPYDPYPYIPPTGGSPPSEKPAPPPPPPYDPHPYVPPTGGSPPPEKPAPPPPYPYPPVPPAGGSPPPPVPSGSTHLRGALSFMFIVSALFYYLNF